MCSLATRRPSPFLTGTRPLLVVSRSGTGSGALWAHNLLRFLSKGGTVGERSQVVQRASELFSARGARNTSEEGSAAEKVTNAMDRASQNIFSAGRLPRNVNYLEAWERLTLQENVKKPPALSILLLFPGGVSLSKVAFRGCCCLWSHPHRWSRCSLLLKLPSPGDSSPLTLLPLA